MTSSYQILEAPSQPDKDPLAHYITCEFEGVLYDHQITLNNRRRLCKSDTIDRNYKLYSRQLEDYVTPMDWEIELHEPSITTIKENSHEQLLLTNVKKSNLLERELNHLLISLSRASADQAANIRYQKQKLEKLKSQLRHVKNFEETFEVPASEALCKIADDIEKLREVRDLSASISEYAQICESRPLHPVEISLPIAAKLFDLSEEVKNNISSVSKGYDGAQQSPIKAAPSTVTKLDSFIRQTTPPKPRLTFRKKKKPYPSKVKMSGKFQKAASALISKAEPSILKEPKRNLSVLVDDKSENKSKESGFLNATNSSQRDIKKIMLGRSKKFMKGSSKKQEAQIINDKISKKLMTEKLLHARQSFNGAISISEKMKKNMTSRKKRNLDFKSDMKAAKKNIVKSPVEKMLYVNSNSKTAVGSRIPADKLLKVSKSTMLKTRNKKTTVTMPPHGIDSTIEIESHKFKFAKETSIPFKKKVQKSILHSDRGVEESKRLPIIQPAIHLISASGTLKPIIKAKIPNS